MRDASRITLLSRKWRKIVSSLSDLTFTKDVFSYHNESDKDYRDFINHILNSHDESPIEKFTLVTTIDGVHITKAHLRDWITFAVTHKVKDLSLDLGYYLDRNNIHELPDCLYTCTTLTVLSLGFITFSHPVRFSFPSLKSLTLCSLQIVGDDSVEEFSLCCDDTSLETLVVHRVIHDKPLNISGANVKCLTLTGTEELDRTINLSMPSLLEFYFKGHKVVNISLEAMLSVRKAGFYLQHPLSTVEIGSRTHWANSLMMGIRKVEMLTVSTLDIKLRSDDLLLEGHIPIPYCSVKQLTINSNNEDYQVYFMSFMLKRFPNLHTLVIHKEERLSTQVENGDGWLLEEGAGGDALQHVKNVDIYSFEGSEAELYLVRYLFDKASVLENMNIYYTPCSDVKYKTISTRLMSFSKSSNNTASINQHK